MTAQPASSDGPAGRIGRRARLLALRAYTIAYARLKGFRVGRGSVVHPGARIATDHGSVSLGRNCVIHAGARILAHGGCVRIGDRVSVNPFSILYGHGGLSIGHGVLIAAHVTIIPANHGLDADLPIRDQPLSRKGITIGSDVWVGTGVRILDGARIAPGCVLAAGCVVTGSLKTRPMAIYGGVPARKISERAARRSGTDARRSTAALTPAC